MNDRPITAAEFLARHDDMTTWSTADWESYEHLLESQDVERRAAVTGQAAAVEDFLVGVVSSGKTRVAAVQAVLHDRLFS